jgi:YHS domain-containing protein
MDNKKTFKDSPPRLMKMSKAKLKKAILIMRSSRIQNEFHGKTYFFILYITT